VKRRTDNEEAGMLKGPIRQGDVLIRSVDVLPKGLKAVPRDGRGRLVLAEGEATGHAHVVEGEALFLAADLADLEGRFLQVEAESAVVHEEHGTLTLSPGIYEVRRQREYESDAERYVAD
jgi:hypothetical protein